MSSFLSTFDWADVIENPFMVTININSGQSTTNFSDDTWEMTVYNIYFLERGKKIIMSHRKLVGHRFPILMLCI